MISYAKGHVEGMLWVGSLKANAENAIINIQQKANLLRINTLYALHGVLTPRTPKEWGAIFAI